MFPTSKNITWLWCNWYYGSSKAKLLLSFDVCISASEITFNAEGPVW